ncbi:hypothetical protein PHYPSEUDO_002790 [Phytophthora pseudosyringae]|uniref:RxLR effector protein n=1 Tax=Phytophthora pseudosyringae TaxID=221518 RepID=A0A8T1VSJ6_9STRA|nr:hypothetical protein PHYPSEUDO_002790 [Phytophthora pseudosyringae]
MSRTSHALRRRLLVLLVAVALAVSGVIADPTPDLSVLVRPSAQNQNQLGPNRLPRTQRRVDKDEERGINANILQWLHSGQSVDDVFKLLKLDDGVEKILSNPNLPTFMEYVNRFNLQNPGNGATAIKTVTAAYGDDVVAKVLQTAKKVSSTKVMAEKLMGDQRILWLGDKKSPAHVFQLLKLDDAATNPLNSPVLDAWTSYLTLFNYVNPGKETTMIKTFTTAYGDAALAKLLNSAKAVPETESIAKNLQLAQFTRWMRKGQNPDKIYRNVFKLDPKLKTPPEPYQTILNHYHWFYQLHLRKNT